MNTYSVYEIILTIIASIVFLMTGLIIYASYSKVGSFIDRLTSKIPTIATFIIALGIIITYQVFTVTLLSARREATYKIVDRAFTNIIKAMDDNYEKCPEFINSLFFPWQKTVFNRPEPTGEEKPDRWTCQLYLSTLIFQSWEDFLTDLESWWDLQVTIEYNETDERSWLAIFLGWAQSKELREIFKTQQLEYNDTTVHLANLMFEYLDKYQINNAEDLDNLTGLIFNDPRYKQIRIDVQT